MRPRTAAHDLPDQLPRPNRERPAMIHRLPDDDRPSMRHTEWAAFVVVVAVLVFAYINWKYVG